MAPKKEQPKEKKAQVDKTFGMKNKKGGAAQREIKRIQASQSASKSADQKRKDDIKAAREAEKAQQEKERKESAELFKPLQPQKVPFGVDPKSVLCQYFKKNLCDKGKKCKFSHDVDVERKGAKRSLYADARDENDSTADQQPQDEQRKRDDMVNWDAEKLAQVVLSKHGNPRTTTEKVCKFFIDAVERGAYGWFWECPNGGNKCMYRHALPAGFVLKTRAQRAAERAAAENSADRLITMEDWLERERLLLTAPGTPVTPETFAKWKRERMDKRAAEEQGRRLKEATGRALFERGELHVSGDEEEDEDEDDSEGEETTRAEWNLKAMRKETEELRAKMEEMRLAALAGVPAEIGDPATVQT